MSQKVIPHDGFNGFEGWTIPKNILVILAHPDDPEFFCGGTIARWCVMGHKVSYCLLTRGQRGWIHNDLTAEQIGVHRAKEQREAADVLGVGEIKHLDFLDGELISDINLRNEVICQIRTHKPDIVVTCDPRTFFTSPNRMNHPDHRAAGMAVFDAVFPAAGNPCYEVNDETGVTLPPHQVGELWLALTSYGDTKVDVTEFFETRMRALLKHRSQIREIEETFRERMAAKMVVDEVRGEKMYIENFCRIRFA